MAKENKIQGTAAANNMIEFRLKEIDQDMPKFLQILIISHPEIYEALSEQFLLLSGILCIENQYKAFYQEDQCEQSQGFAFFNAIENPSLLTHIGEMTSALKVNLNQNKDSLSKSFDFLKYVQLRLSYETLGLVENTEGFDFVTPNNCTWTRNHLHQAPNNTLVIGSNLSGHFEESMQNHSAITIDSFYSLLTKSARTYLAQPPQSGEDTNRDEYLLPSFYFQSSLEIADKHFNVALSEQGFDLDKNSEHLSDLSKTALSTYLSVADNQFALRTCIAVYLIHAEAFESFAKAHPDSTLVACFNNKIRPFLDQEFKTLIYSQANEKEVFEQLNLNDYNCPDIQNRIKVLQSYAGSSEFKFFKFFAICSLISLRNISLNLNSVLNTEAIFDVAMGYALAVLEQPSDPEIFLNIKDISNFKAICDTELFSTKSSKNIARNKIFDKDSNLGLTTLRANFDKALGQERDKAEKIKAAGSLFSEDQGQIYQPFWTEDDIKIIDTFLHELGKTLTNDEFLRAQRMIFTLGWNRLEPLLKIDEKSKNKNNPTFSNLHEATVNCFKNYRIQHAELQSTRDHIKEVELALGSSLQDNDEEAEDSQEGINNLLKTALCTLKPNGAKRNALTPEMKLELKNFYLDPTNIEIIKSDPKVNNGWMNVVFEEQEVYKDFLAGLYALLLSSYQSKSNRIDDQVRLQLTLDSKSLRDFEKDHMAGMQLFSMLYGSTLREMCLRFSQFKVEFILDKESWIFDPHSKEPLLNTAFALIDFNAFYDLYLQKERLTRADIGGKSSKSRSGQKISQLEFHLIVPNVANKQDESVSGTHDIQLCWPYPVDSVGIEMVKLLKELNKGLEEVDGTLDSAEMSKDQLLEQLNKYRALFNPIKIEMRTVQSWIDLNSKWGGKEGKYSFLPLENKADDTKARKHKQTDVDESYLESALINFVDNLTENLEQYGDEEEQRELLQKALRFTHLYAHSISSLLHGALDNAHTQESVKSFNELLSMVMSQFSDEDLQKTLVSLVNLGVAFTEPSSNNSEVFAIILPWSIMSLHAQVLKKQQWINCFAPIFDSTGELCEQLALIDKDIVKDNVLLLSKHSFAPEIVISPFVLTEQNTENEPIRYLIPDSESVELVQGCTLMTPLYTKPIQQIWKNAYSDIHAKKLCELLSVKYLQNFAQYKSELNILLYQCPSSALIFELFQHLLNEVKNAGSLLSKFKINIYAMYNKDSNSGTNLFYPIYHELFSRLNKDDIQTTLMMNNSQDFKHSVLLFVVDQEQWKETHKSQDKFFDVSLLFDISQCYGTMLYFNRLKSNLFEDTEGTENTQDHAMIAPAYLPSLSNKMGLIRDKFFATTEFFGKFLVLPSASADLKQYLKVMYSLDGDSYDIKENYEDSMNSLPMLILNNSNNSSLRQALQFVHEHCKLVISLDQLLYKSSMKQCLGLRASDEENFSLIFYHNDIDIDRIILFSSNSSTIDPDLDFNLKQALKDFYQDLDNIHLSQFVPSIFRQASALSGTLILRSQSSLNATKELLGLVLSSTLLQQLQVLESNNLKQPQGSGNQSWKELFHGQIMLDDNLDILYKNSNQHADIISAHVYYTGSDKAPSFKIVLYVAESKFMSNNQYKRGNEAVNQARTSCRPLQLLCDYHNKASDRDPSFAEQIVLSWLNNILTNVCEQYYMRKDKLGAKPDLIISLQEQLFKGKVEVTIKPVVFLNLANDEEVKESEFEIKGGNGAMEIAQFKINKNTMRGLLGQLDVSKQNFHAFFNFIENSEQHTELFRFFDLGKE